MAGRLAICPKCRYAFAAATGLSVAYCQRCGAEALVSDGSARSLFTVFNEAFPTATPPKVRREIWRLAKAIAAAEYTPKEAIAAASPAARDALERRASLIMNFIMMIAALWGMYQTQQASESAEQQTVRMIGLLAEIQQALEGDDGLRGFTDPEESAAPSRQQTQPRPRTGSGAKSRSRKRATKRTKPSSA